MTQDTVLRERLQTGFLGIIAFALLMFMLVQGRFILIALAIAIIIFSLTSDAIGAISKLRLPSWLATALALVLIAGGLLWISTTIVGQINEVVSTAMSYAEQIQTTLPRLTEWLGPNAQEALDTILQNLNLTGWLRSLAGQASNLLSGTVLVILFVGFMFAERVWFPIKMLRLTGNDRDAQHVRNIITSIMRRVNRYLIVKTAVSAVTASIVWGIFTLARVDLAGPVAMLTFILNFIPSIGSIIATLIATLLVLVLTSDIEMTVIIGISCTLTQFIIGNVLDPMLLGQTLRLSSFGIILSLAFWGAVWGIPGMFLAVPIMVALMIVCAHTDWMRPLAVLLSREGLPDDGITEQF